MVWRLAFLLCWETPDCLVRVKLSLLGFAGMLSDQACSGFARVCLYCRTSKMSHDHSRHESCRLQLYSRWIHSILLSLARGMTAVVVGSGALLGYLMDLIIRETS